MAHYSRNIEQLPALNDPCAERSLEQWGGHAPAVTFGQPRDLNDVARACEECNDLEFLRRSRANVTNFEIASAELRKSQVLVEHGNGPVTMNAIQELLANNQRQIQAQLGELNRQIQDQLTGQNQQIARIQDQQTGQNQQMAQMQAQLVEQNRQMQAQNEHFIEIQSEIKNADAKRFNFRAINSSMTDRLTHRLRPLCKTIQGYGPGLPERTVPASPPAMVGTSVPLELFPETVGKMERLTHMELSRISAWLNDDFGIVAGDSIEERRNKFRYHIS